MQKNANENIDVIKEKLEYIGLDLNEIPNWINEYKPLEYNTSKGSEEHKYKIYKYIDVKDIQILITPKNRLDSLSEKYKNAQSLSKYITQNSEENIIQHTIFLDMLKTVNIQKINEIEELQEKFVRKNPFKVKYKDNYLWQIYYSEVSETYFMLVPSEDSEYACFFYLLKKQIESYKNKKEIKIYVPISNMDYTGQILKKSELTDIENYLWLLTKDWPYIYEVFDKRKNATLQIAGETVVYEKIKSQYKIKLKNKEEAIKFYKLIKALFILQTELPSKYEFSPKVDRFGSIDFYYNSKKVTYDILPEFIEKEYLLQEENLKNSIEEKYNLENELESLQEISKKKELEYLEKEKEISTYLECKKTFFGRIKYFFKHKKGSKKGETSEEIKENGIKKEEISEETKRFYTIEDLIKISKEFIKRNEIVKKLLLDKKALREKIDMMEMKIRNAIQYIEEIDNHNKSIFDFWKFTNKDEALALNKGKEIESNNTNKIDKVFDYTEDFEELGKQMDEIQRKDLTKEECESIFSTTKTLDILNIIKNSNRNYIKKENEDIINGELQKLQQIASNEEELFNKEEFDIFGGITEDSTKIKTINGKKHREVERNILKILDVNKSTDQKDFIEKEKKLLKTIEEAINKIENKVNMSIYKISNGSSLEKNNLDLFDINPEKALNLVEDENSFIHKINIKKGVKAVYLSNIIYYDNNNKTLPIGMDLDDRVLVDLEKVELKTSKKINFKIVEDDEENIKVKSISIIEYDINE